MQDFDYGGRTLRFRGRTGVVSSQKVYSQTTVQGSGGGGYVHNGSGVVNDVHITSTTMRCHEIWLRDDAGKAHPVDLGGANIPLEEGQRVTICWAQGPKREGVALLVNHTAERYWQVCDTPHLAQLIFFWAADHQVYGWLLVIAALIVAGLTTWWLAAIALIGVTAWGLLATRKVCRALDEHLGRLGLALLG